MVDTQGGACYFSALPARELDGMITTSLRPWLEGRGSEGGLEQRSLRIACLPESRVEELIAPAYEEFGREQITVLAKPGEIEVRVTAAGHARDRAERLDQMLSRLTELVGTAVSVSPVRPISVKGFDEPIEVYEVAVDS